VCTVQTWSGPTVPARSEHADFAASSDVDVVVEELEDDDFVVDFFVVVLVLFDDDAVGVLDESHAAAPTITVAAAAAIKTIRVDMSCSCLGPEGCFR
jgi:hypothetical protein